MFCELLNSGVDKRGQLGRIALACDQRIDDRPTAFAHDVGNHRIQLDVGVFERLLQPLDMAGLLADQFVARAQQRAQILRLGFRLCVPKT